MANNNIEVKILDNGDVRIETSKFDHAQHAAAEDVLKAISEALGSTASIERRAHHGHSHTHATQEAKQQQS